MGLYVNPSESSKENWLKENGERISQPSTYADIDDKKAAVCLVDNGMFTAAGIVTDQRELEAFSNTGDLRPKWWYLVPRAKLYDPNVSAAKPEFFD